MKTTLNKIRDHSPCKDGWAKLLNHLGKTAADDEPVAITMIIDSNGLDDALWCLRAVESHDHEIRLYAVWCARQVQHLMTNKRSLDALDVVERYANGQTTDQELAAARDAARAVAWPAREAAWAAASAAREAAPAAAWAAARDAAWAAARDAAGEAAWAAARAAAWAAREAAWAAASAAREAAWAVARAAAWDAQEKQLRKVCTECEVTV